MDCMTFRPRDVSDSDISDCTFRTRAFRTGLFFKADVLELPLLWVKSILSTPLIYLINYFDTTYVSGYLRPRARRAQPDGLRLNFHRIPQPPPPPPLSSFQHDVTRADQPRTNNVSEGWNNKFQSLVNITILQSGSSLSDYKSSVLGFLASLSKMNAVSDRGNEKKYTLNSKPDIVNFVVRIGLRSESPSLNSSGVLVTT